MNLTVEIVQIPLTVRGWDLLSLTNNPFIKTRPFFLPRGIQTVEYRIIIEPSSFTMSTFILNNRLCQRLWRLLEGNKMTKSQDWVIITDFLNKMRERFWNLGRFSEFFQSTVLFWRFVLSEFYISVITVFNQINYFRETTLFLVDQGYTTRTVECFY